MVARVKDKGLHELQQFKSRVLRQKAMQRIKSADADWLIGRVEEVERYVARMDEKPELEREFL